MEALSFSIEEYTNAVTPSLSLGGDDVEPTASHPRLELES